MDPPPVNAVPSCSQKRKRKTNLRKCGFPARTREGGKGGKELTFPSRRLTDENGGVAVEKKKGEEKKRGSAPARVVGDRANRPCPPGERREGKGHPKLTVERKGPRGPGSTAEEKGEKEKGRGPPPKSYRTRILQKPQKKKRTPGSLPPPIRACTIHPPEKQGKEGGRGKKGGKKKKKKIGAEVDHLDHH